MTHRLASSCIASSPPSSPASPLPLPAPHRPARRDTAPPHAASLHNPPATPLPLPAPLRPARLDAAPPHAASVPSPHAVASAIACDIKGLSDWPVGCAFARLVVVFLRAVHWTKQTASPIEEEVVMSAEEQLASQEEGAMSLGSEGSEQLLDSSTKKNSGSQDVGESSAKATAMDAGAFAEAGSRAPVAPVINPLDPLSKDTPAPLASAPGATLRLVRLDHLVTEVVPQSKPNEAVVFCDYYEAGLRLPAWGFLERVLERYSVQIHHLTPNAFVQLSKFIWAVRSQNAKLSFDAFIRFYSCHLQNKKVPFDDDVFHSQYGLCTFQPRYFGRRSKVKKNEDGTECFPLASQIVAAEPIFSPDYESTSTFQPCCKAFRLSCKVISGRTVVEEFIAAGIWPVGTGWKAHDLVERRVGGRKFCPIAKVEDMSKLMKVRFNKYLTNVHGLMEIPAVLDPRMTLTRPSLIEDCASCGYGALSLISDFIHVLLYYW
ncbi:hypothetical protein EJB05_19901, partial [Eragrostis curvula]